MENQLRQSLLILLLILSCNIFGIIPQEITEAIGKLDYGFIDFKYKFVDDQLMNGKHLVRVSEFQPNSEIQFDLLTENGKEASLRDKKSYNKDKINLFGKDRFLEDTSFSFTQLVDASEYTLIDSRDGISRYSFTNRNSVIPDSDTPLYGELLLDEENKDITYVVLKNIEPMKVFIGITISDFQLNFKIEPSISQYSLIEEIKCEINGNVLFMDIDYTSNLYLSNYRKNE